MGQKYMRRFFTTISLLSLISACGAVDSSVSETQETDENALPYLALGDSIVFGMSPLFEVNDENVRDGLFIGYPELVAEMTHFKLTNSGCPGETTSSFIDKDAVDNGCHTGEHPRHDHLKVEYDVSQLDFAKDFLIKHPETKLVTLTFGGNDLLLVQDTCDLESNPTFCKITKLPGTAITFAKNLSKTIDALRDTGYQGQIIFVTQYAKNYTDTIQKLALGTVQTEVCTVAKLKGITMASGYDAFKKATEDFDGDSCKAGLLIEKADGTCDQHPSAKGRKLLAQTVMESIK